MIWRDDAQNERFPGSAAMGGMSNTAALALVGALGLVITVAPAKAHWNRWGWRPPVYGYVPPPPAVYYVPPPRVIYTPPPVINAPPPVLYPSPPPVYRPGFSIGFGFR
jgi:hypothetical protein